MQYHSFTRICVRIVFLFRPLKKIISLSADNGLFHRYHRRQLTFPSNLLISLSPTSVTCRSDRYYHQKSNPKTSYFHHLTGVRVSEVHEEASPNDNANEPSINHWSLVPRGRLTRGSVSQLLWYIYAHPKTAPDQGMLNRYIPSRETPQRWGALPCPSDPQLGVGVCCVVSLTRMMQHGESNTPPKTTLYITCGTSSTCAAPP